MINCVTYNFLIVYNCFASYFSTQKDHSSFGNRLCNCNRSNQNSFEKMFLEKVFFIHSFHRANDLRSFSQGKMHISCHCYENLKRQKDIAKRTHLKRIMSTRACVFKNKFIHECVRSEHKMCNIDHRCDNFSCSEFILCLYFSFLTSLQQTVYANVI